MTDDAILTLTRNPETREEGFRQLVIKHQKQLYQLVRRQITSHEDADDVLQNTFIKVFRYLGSFEGRSELYTWIYRIAANEIINHHKKYQKMAVVELDASYGREAEGHFNAEEVYASLEEMVKRLPERQREVFRMRYYDELSYKQIAEILNRTEGALKASFHHAVRKIEEELKANQIV